jgi:hypothetical protein
MKFRKHFKGDASYKSLRTSGIYENTGLHCLEIYAVCDGTYLYIATVGFCYRSWKMDMSFLQNAS